MRAYEVWSTTETSRHVKIKVSVVLHKHIADSIVAALIRSGEAAEVREIVVQATERSF